MLKAMDSAVAGLRAHQNKLDVIGNNIANVNTNGYKAQNYTFKDSLYTTAASSSGGQATNGSATVGGINASQYGYGSMTGVISTDMSSTTPNYVGGFNASINGAGFFVTKSTNIRLNLQEVDKTKPDEAATKAASNSALMKNSQFSFTRVGQFSIDANGYIVDANQNFVYGYQPASEKVSYKDKDGKTQEGMADITNPEAYDMTHLQPLRAPVSITFDADNVNSTALHIWSFGTYSAPNGGYASPDTSKNQTAIQMKSVSVDDSGIIKGIVQNDQGNPVTIVLGKVAIASFQNPEGLTKAGNNTFVTSNVDNSGTVTTDAPGGATSTLMAGYLEGSNVDLAKEFSDMITTERGFQANSKLITVSDEVLQELVNMKR
ncbi:MAG: flagellar hook-basal body complex protein [Lachnospiraceae bacterium]|nr:flagellar hook-basal body complex protein [Lachnospiraceae bacterium]